jgi:hypothetical protein
MPWTALLDSKVTDLRDVTSSDRVAMHEDRPPWRCRGCGGPMHMRYYDQSNDIDPIRFRYFIDKSGPFIGFAHNPGEAERCQALGFHTDESAEHLEMKQLLCEAATAKGWDPETEVHHTLDDGTSCRADVVISRAGETSRVLEAQRSPLGPDEAVRRSQLYRKAFGPVLWTHTRQRPWARRLPSLRVDEENIGTVIDGVYVDQAGREAIPPTDLVGVLPRILPPDRELTWVFVAEDFGFFYPLGGPPPKSRKRRRRREPSPETTPAGSSVRECAIGAEPVVALVKAEERVTPSVQGITPLSLLRCPRCGKTIGQRFYGPCTQCRDQLRGDTP